MPTVMLANSLALYVCIGSLFHSTRPSCSSCQGDLIECICRERNMNESEDKSMNIIIWTAIKQAVTIKEWHYYPTLTLLKYDCYSYTQCHNLFEIISKLFHWHDLVWVNNRARSYSWIICPCFSYHRCILLEAETNIVQWWLTAIARLEQHHTAKR